MAALVASTAPGIRVDGSQKRRDERNNFNKLA